MTNYFIGRTLETSPMLSLEQGINIYHLLAKVVAGEVEGDVVELGCWGGQTALLMQQTLDNLGSAKALHVYDSFAGLPAKHANDGHSYFKEGWCRIDEGALRQLFDFFGVKQPQVHAGWFADTLPSGLPGTICFAHLDGDFYTSIRESLEHVYPRLAPGGVAVIDDYCDPVLHASVPRAVAQNRFRAEGEQRLQENFDLLPGVKVACDEFFADKPEQVTPLFAGMAPHGCLTKQ